MGTKIWSQTVAVAGRILAFPMAALIFCISGLAHAESLATEKVIQFLTNAYTGVVMDSNEWLTTEAQRSKRFKEFGGLDVLVKQSTAFAREYKGLSSVAIQTTKEGKRTYHVVAEVKFFDDERRRNSPAIAEREEILWKILVVQEKGKWRLSFW